MTNRLFGFPLILALFAAGCFFEFERGSDLQPGEVVGRVVQDGAVAVVGAKVRPQGMAREVVSGEGGAFVLNDVPPGSWLLRSTFDSEGDGVPELAGRQVFSIEVVRHGASLFSAGESRAEAALLGDVLLNPTVNIPGTVELTEEVGGTPAPAVGAQVFLETWFDPEQVVIDEGGSVQDQTQFTFPSAEPATANDDGVFELLGVEVGVEHRAFARVSVDVEGVPTAVCSPFATVDAQFVASGDIDPITLSVNAADIQAALNADDLDVRIPIRGNDGAPIVARLHVTIERVEIDDLKIPFGTPRTGVCSGGVSDCVPDSETVTMTGELLVIEDLPCGEYEILIEQLDPELDPSDPDAVIQSGTVRVAVGPGEPEEGAFVNASPLLLDQPLPVDAGPTPELEVDAGPPEPLFPAPWVNPAKGRSDRLKLQHLPRAAGRLSFCGRSKSAGFWGRGQPVGIGRRLHNGLRDTGSRGFRDE